jgi:4-carboxymuconolactone decarboxylase
MPRIPYANPASLPDPVRATVERSINVVRMMAGASEAVYHGFNQFAGAFYGRSKLDAQLREIAILRVGYVSKSLYQPFHHESLARLLGLSDAQIEAIRCGGDHTGVLTAAQQAVLDLTDDLLKNVRASDAALGAVRRFLSDTEVLDLTLVIGLYMMIARFLETAGVELDPTPLNWKALNVVR